VQSYFDRLTATIEKLGATRSVLRQVITLADDVATLSDKELRDRLVVLAGRARLAQHPVGMTAGQSHRFGIVGITCRSNRPGAER
jgi:hypothetical protein